MSIRLTPYQVDELLRDLLARALHEVDRRRGRDDLIPALMGECRVTERALLDAVPDGERERLQDRLLIALRLNGRCDAAVHLSLFAFVGAAIEHEFDAAQVARHAAMVRDVLTGEFPDLKSINPATMTQK